MFRAKIMRGAMKNQLNISIRTPDHAASSPKNISGTISCEPFFQSWLRIEEMNIGPDATIKAIPKTFGSIGSICTTKTRIKERTRNILFSNLTAPMAISPHESIRNKYW